MSSPQKPKRPLLKRTSIRIVLVVVALVAAFAVYELTRPEPPLYRASGQFMKAAVYHDYGSPDVIRLEQIDKPLPGDDQVLIKVHAAALNPLDWHYMEGAPYIMRLMGAGLMKPKDPRLGVDVAGVVESVGKNVTKFKPGDAVYGVGDSAFAEYSPAPEGKIALKPADISFEQAAAVPIAGITALQGLRDAGQLKAGQKILINGASGGVGTFAVQIAKSYGAEVTAVCSTKNVDLVRSLGADHIIDYTKEDFAQSNQKYDVIYDNVANRPLLSYRHLLKPSGIYVLVGGGGPEESHAFLGPVRNWIKAGVLSWFVKQKFATFLANINGPDLMALNKMMEAKSVTPVIDRTYALDEVPAAMRYVEAGHARGKVIIVVAPES
ncbi:MAG TPA: NAD(P)-dependent alcohol dehydrogenase [Steroidobacteraceae bacterium]